MSRFLDETLRRLRTLAELRPRASGLVRVLLTISLAVTFLLSLGSARAAPADPVAKTQGAPPAASDRVLVKFKRDVSHGAAARELTRMGARSRGRTKHSGVDVVEITQAGKSVEDVIEESKASGLVEYVEPDYVVSIDRFPSDPLFSELWGLHNAGQTGGAPDADIDAPEAWDVTTGDSSIVVAVIDTGVDYNHEDLADNMWRNPGELVNGIDDDGNGYVDDVFGIDAITGSGDPFDDHYHGTHVAGTLGAVHDNGRGVTGVAGEVQIMALKFLSSGGWGYTSDAIECLEYATRMKTEFGVNLKLTSNSWGGGGFSQALSDAIEASGNAGMLFVAAAGNSASDNDAIPHYPSSYGLPNVVAVAATNASDGLSWFSSYGPSSVDLAAPGEGILSSIPGDEYWWLSGTSMATPHVSGAAALIWALHPEGQALAVKDVLLATADPLASLTGRVASNGRLNASAALSACEAATPSLHVSLADGFSVSDAEDALVQVWLSQCVDPVLDATVVVKPVQEGDRPGAIRRATLTALDDGVAPDAVANDGVYSALWSPAKPGAVRLEVEASFASGSLADSVSGNVVQMPHYVILDDQGFEWVDATQGTNAGIAFDDGDVEIPIGFGFNFYGTLHETLRISSNGYLTFGSPGFAYWNEPIPSASEPNGLIAPYWDDLDPRFVGNVFYLLEGDALDRRLTVEWHQVPYFPGNGLATFEVTLFEQSGAMRFQYLGVNAGVPQDFGASATIGIEDHGGLHGVQYSFDEPAVGNGTALLVLDAPECTDGRDNDGDGAIDFPADRKCASRLDDSERRGGTTR